MQPTSRLRVCGTSVLSIRTIRSTKHNSSDRFGAAQRLRTQIDVIASESLKGVVYFEIGDTHWGHAKDGASLGTDGRTVEVRYSYIDWAIPETDVLVRMACSPS